MADLKVTTYDKLDKAVGLILSNRSFEGNGQLVVYQSKRNEKSFYLVHAYHDDCEVYPIIPRENYEDIKPHYVEMRKAETTLNYKCCSSIEILFKEVGKMYQFFHDISYREGTELIFSDLKSAGIIPMKRLRRDCKF